MKPASRSHGAVLLDRAGLTQPEIGARVGVSRALAGHWISGRRVPKDTHRAALLEAFAIPVASWDAPFVARTLAEEKAPSVPPPAWVDGTVRARAAQLDAILRRLIAEAERSETLNEVARVAQSAATTLKLLGTITGETLDIPEERLLRIPAYRRIAEKIVEASAKWPECQRALSEILLRYDQAG